MHFLRVQISRSISQKAAGARAEFQLRVRRRARKKRRAAAKQGQSQCNLCATHLQLEAFFGLCVRGLERARPKPGVPFFDQKRAFLLRVEPRRSASSHNHFPPIALVASCPSRADHRRWTDVTICSTRALMLVVIQPQQSVQLPLCPRSRGQSPFHTPQVNIDFSNRRCISFFFLNLISLA